MLMIEYLIKCNYRSIKDFSRHCDIPYETLLSYCNGKRTPSLYNFMSLCEMLHVKPKDLWKGWYKET